jgi:hypothetical protein
VSAAPVGLRLLEPLSNSTGGALYLYPSPDEAPLPQDVYRRLAPLHALSALLRVRTSPQLKVVSGGPGGVLYIGHYVLNACGREWRQAAPRRSSRW